MVLFEREKIFDTYCTAIYSYGITKYCNQCKNVQVHLNLLIFLCDYRTLLFQADLLEHCTVITRAFSISHKYTVETLSRL